MLASTTHQSSLFYFAFDREAALIKDDLLEPIDRLFDDADLIELVREAQARRAPAARTMGRKTIAPDRLLRCCALKHISALGRVTTSSRSKRAHAHRDPESDGDAR